MRKVHGLFYAAALLVLAMQWGCASTRVSASPAFSVAQNQMMLPIQPFSSILASNAFTESVFNDFVDTMNENSTRTPFTWFGIIKEDLTEVEQILAPGHIYLSGEVWSYLEDTGCCSTAISVKSRIRIHRVVSRELLWEAEIPLETFFEHDNSSLAIEREKFEKRLSMTMANELIKGLKAVKRVQLE